MTRGRLQHVIANFRQQLANREQAALHTLAQAHQRTMEAIHPHLDALMQQIDEKQQADGSVPLHWLYEQKRLQSIQSLITRGFDSYGAYAQQLTTLLQHQAVQLGLNMAQTMLQGSVPKGVNWTFGLPSQDAIANIVGATSKGSPLAELFNGFGAEAAQKASEALINGVTLGDNPRKVASDIAQALNVSYNRAAVISRDQMNKAYRAANMATFRANSDVVQQWRWCCSLSPRTCPACLAMDGTLHDLDEELDDHPCGRCFPMPITKSWSDILGDDFDTSDLSDTSITDGMQSGADWFDQQSAETQQQILGPGAYKLYVNGDITLADMVTKTHDKQWGGSIQQTTLKELQKR